MFVHGIFQIYGRSGREYLLTVYHLRRHSLIKDIVDKSVPVASGDGVRLVWPFCLATGSLKNDTRS